MLPEILMILGVISIVISLCIAQLLDERDGNETHNK